MMEPLVIVNFKTYKKATGQAAVSLTQACAESGAQVAVQAVDIQACAATGAQVWAQHVDSAGYGSHTGAVIVEAVKAAGAIGTLLNHSEHRLDDPTIGETVKRCKELGLKTVVCAASVEEAERYKAFAPDYIAVEIPALIGGDVSIMNAEPGIVKRAVEQLGSNVLVGAGVSSGDDLKTAMDEGAAGVLLASAIAKKADDPKAALRELYSKLT